ncbi:MAG: hypothetical protein GX301_13555, partial [Gracilibacteraceae bacterium]|nr:hypothetical protein [Gracilibacteraceae bacterium]
MSVEFVDSKAIRNNSLLACISIENITSLQGMVYDTNMGPYLIESLVNGLNYGGNMVEFL